MNEKDCDITVCDSMVRKLLPAMRAEMVSRLVNKQGMSQSDAAKKLGLTRAAISQYLSRKRGDAGIEISPDMNSLLDRWAMSVAGTQESITLCDICQCAMKNTGQQKKELPRYDKSGLPGFKAPSSSGPRRKEKEY
jgi:hypothetical protein